MNLIKKLIRPPLKAPTPRAIVSAPLTATIVPVSNNTPIEEQREEYPVIERSEYGPERNTRDDPNFKTIDPPKRLFRLQRHLISLTVWNLQYEGRSITKEVVHDNLLRYYKKNEIHWFIVARELGSQTQREHLHVLVYFNKKIDTKDFKYFNKVTHQENYRDLQVHINEAKNIDAAIPYITKDGDFVTFGDAPIGQLKREKPLEIICRGITEGSSSLAELRKEFPSTFVIHGKKIEEFYNRFMEDKQSFSIRDWDVRCINQQGLNQYELQVLEWIFLNFPPLCKQGKDRAARRHKQKQLYLWGRPDSYKTTLCLVLDEFFHGMPAQEEETFYDHLNRDQWKYGFVYFEEFAGNKTISHLNQFMEGVKMALKAKGTQFIKFINYPVMILANSSLEECYSHAAELHPARFEALKTRLFVVELYMQDYNKNNEAEVRQYTLKTLCERIKSMNLEVQYEDINGFMKKVHMTNEMRARLVQSDKRMLNLARDLGYGNQEQLFSDEEVEEDSQSKNESEEEDDLDILEAQLNKTLTDNDILLNIGSRGHLNRNTTTPTTNTVKAIEIDFDDLL